MVHLEHGSAAFEVLGAAARTGVPAEAVVLAHIDRNPDPGLHAEIGRGRRLPRLRRDGEEQVLARLGRAGLPARGPPSSAAGDRILLGGDVARRTRYVAYGGMPGLAYLVNGSCRGWRPAGSPEWSSG